VLHLKMVTQCAMLEDFGIFLVLADKVRRTMNWSYASLTMPCDSHCSLITWKHSSRRHRKVLIPLRRLKSSMEPKMSTSSVWALFMVALS
jgi:hypothetical protein